MRPWVETGFLFFKLGCTAFGGPAAHIALMRRECVQRRKWLEESRFLDLLGAVQLIPGPNSTEMALHLGWLRAGWAGLLAAGAGFIGPAAAIAMGLAWAYARAGTLPQAEWLLYGIKPVVLALILQAVVGLAPAGLKGWREQGIFAAALAAYLAGGNEIAILIAGGLAGWALRIGKREAGGPAARGAGWLAALWAAPGAVAAAPLPLATIFLKCLKIGAVLYGSGYVLLPLVRAVFAGPGGPLTETQVLDAIAVGQMTPGPFLASAAFLGYLLGGVPGGGLATLGIFLPAFVFVLISNPHIPRLRASQSLGRALDGVNAVSLALMGGAAWAMGRVAVSDWGAAGLLAGAAILLRKGWSPTLVTALGGVIGITLRAWMG